MKPERSKRAGQREHSFRIMPDEEVVTGRHPVAECIRTRSGVKKIFIAASARGGAIAEIRELAHTAEIPVLERDPRFFEAFGTEAVTQGVIGLLRVKPLAKLHDIINGTHGKQDALLLLLDCVQDPQNVGAIIRSAACAGVNGVIITTHNSAPVNETVRKTSAGGFDHVQVCQVVNLSETIDELKKHGFWVIGSTLAGGAVPHTSVNYHMPVALVVGNEQKGIRRLTAEKCDVRVKIEMKGKLDSLNVSVAAGILLFEVLRCRATATA